MARPDLAWGPAGHGAHNPPWRSGTLSLVPTLCVGTYHRPLPRPACVKLRQNAHVRSYQPPTGIDSPPSAVISARKSSETVLESRWRVDPSPNATDAPSLRPPKWSVRKIDDKPICPSGNSRVADVRSGRRQVGQDDAIDETCRDDKPIPNASASRLLVVEQRDRQYCDVGEVRRHLFPKRMNGRVAATRRSGPAKRKVCHDQSEGQGTACRGHAGDHDRLHGGSVHASSGE